MTYINTRDLQTVMPSTRSNTGINTLDRLVGVAYSKLIWFKDTNGNESGYTLRHIDVQKSIDYLEEYLETNKDNNLYAVVRGNKSKRKLLDALKILKDK